MVTSSQTLLPLANLGIERFYSLKSKFYTEKKTMNQQTYENKALEVLG